MNKFKNTILALAFVFSHSPAFAEMCILGKQEIVLADDFIESLTPEQRKYLDAALKKAQADPEIELEYQPGWEEFDLDSLEATACGTLSSNTNPTASAGEHF